MSEPTQSFKLIVGLGNPGSQYVCTWHNLGFFILDQYVLDSRGSWSESDRYASAEVRESQDKVFCLKPLTFMNLSGEALAPFARKKGVQGDQILVIHDEVDLPLGTVRLKWAGGSGGHRGLESIFSHFGKDFYRLRVGVAKDPVLSTADHVLKKQKRDDMQALADKGYAALNVALREERSKAFNLINRMT